MKPVRYLYEIKPAAPTASSSNVPNTLPTTLEEELSAKGKTYTNVCVFREIKDANSKFNECYSGNRNYFFRGRNAFLTVTYHK